MAPARRNTSGEPPEPSLKAPKARAKELIARGIEEARDLLNRVDQVTNHESYRVWTQDVERWDARTEAALASVFQGPFPEEFHDAATRRIVRFVNQDDDDTFAFRREAIERAMNTLTSIDERLEFLAEPGGVDESRPAAPGGRQVFVVHGHDELLREQVARLISRLGLDPLILSEQTDRGRTI